jgi:4-amino-4-deoxy-L-arabinose transferase-like glycosyltransferase
MKTLYKNIYILISLFIFTILIIPFITTLPLRDGNVDFVQSYYFFQGGYDTFFQHFSSAHPPLKVLALSSLYHILGIHSEIIILLGYISGIGGIISAFIIGKNISNLKTGGFFAIFLSVNPLFLSTSIFALTDYLLTNLILICIALLLDREELLDFFSLNK